MSVEQASNFEKIWDAIANKEIVFNCISEFAGDSNCEGDDPLYVYSTSPYQIMVCVQFWTSPIANTRSRAGFIVHEISHFDVVAGTEDIAYGLEPCRKLAIDNPSDAINNADSYRYFAMNQPSLSITNSLVDFASSICVNKPFSVKANLMPILRIPEKDATSLKEIMSSPIVELPI